MPNGKKKTAKHTHTKTLVLTYRIIDCTLEIGIYFVKMTNTCVSLVNGRKIWIEREIFDFLTKFTYKGAKKVERMQIGFQNYNYFFNGFSFIVFIGLVYPIKTTKLNPLKS